jgi:uncharacterized protein (TIGR00725 family)
MTLRASATTGPLRNRPRIAVVGEREALPDLLLLAEQVGAHLAHHGAIMLCGGMGGVMEAASRGCRQAGGLVVGILPTEDANDANAFVDIPIVTGMGEGRNIILVRSAQAVIAIGGSYGTLSEIAFALRLALPVIAIRSWMASRERGEPDPIVRTSDPDDAVKKALALASS